MTIDFFLYLCSVKRKSVLLLMACLSLTVTAQRYAPADFNFSLIAAHFNVGGIEELDDDQRKQLTAYSFLTPDAYVSALGGLVAITAPKWSLSRDAQPALLSEFHRGNSEAAFRQLKETLLHNVYDSSAPKDSVAAVARPLLEGLFGIQLDQRQHRCVLHPGFPDNWDEVAVHTPEMDYTFRRVGSSDLYFEVTQHVSRPMLVTLRLNLGQGHFQDIQGTAEKHQVFRVKAPLRLPDVRVIQ